MANEKRNASIDITKFILALIVVMLHSATECLGTEHMAVRVIEYSGRFVVQFFLMVSGYYFTKMLVEKGTGFLRFFVRMMKIYLLWSAIYISLSFAVNVLLNGNSYVVIHSSIKWRECRRGSAWLCKEFFLCRKLLASVVYGRIDLCTLSDGTIL